KLTSVTCALPGAKFIYIDIPTGPDRYSLYIEINYAITNRLTGEVTRTQVGGCFYSKQLIPATAKTFEIEWSCVDAIAIENIYYTFSNNIKWECGQGPNPKCYSTNAENPVSTPLYAIATPNEILCHGDQNGTIVVTPIG